MLEKTDNIANNRPVGNIVVTGNDNGPPLPPESKHRAVHRIRLSALFHNYACVESAASRQRCSVIVVVKADGYGHGAIPTALHLADYCGADAFAVATLEEAIALRRAFEATADRPRLSASKPSVTSLFPSTDATSSEDTTHTVEEETFQLVRLKGKRKNRPPRIRILVLGPPVDFPRCFDDYLHHDVEVMVSGPEVAQSLLAWVTNVEERRRSQVQRAAAEAKAKALREAAIEEALTNHQTIEGASTLGNVSGEDLAKELRDLLLQRQKAKSTKKPISRTGTPSPGEQVSTSQAKGQVFGGIENVAKDSRNRELAAARANEVCVEDEGISLPLPPTTKIRKRLRWHALVDSGMGRLGFKTDIPVGKLEGNVKRRDTVTIIKELVDCEILEGGPIEFFGMCTHMAEAVSTSNYTTTQIGKFKSLLRRVREAGISIPTVSTDNSSALLTTSLTHFDPKEILSQPNADTRGFVRTGGAIYGQRPSFPQLKAVSTLLASVRHVAVLKKGDTVGYDRAYTAPMNVRIATLTIGFADGYPRELGNGKGKVEIRGSVFPVAGNVCMDMMMVELGAAEDKTGVGAQVVVGDTAVLWGPVDEQEVDGQVKLSDIAGSLSTTQSALTCGLDKTRVRRQLA